MYSGLVVDEIMGMQHFEVDGFQGEAHTGNELVDQFVAGAYQKDGKFWYVFNLYQLADDPQFLHAATF
jgi:twitching motility protein PilI